MVENENETLRDRVADLEKKVHDQNDEITCLRATLADALRRINFIESGKGKLHIYGARWRCTQLVIKMFFIDCSIAPSIVRKRKF